MKRTRLLVTLVAVAVIAVLTSDAFARNRMYNPATGTFMQRDPMGTPNESPLTRNVSSSRFTQRDLAEQYTDGMSLYQYARSAPTVYVDPSGLWSKDFHHDYTLELAKMAGIACAEEVAAGCNRPDEDERDAPSSFKKALAMDAEAKAASLVGKEQTAQRLRQEAQRLRQQAGEWHFPVSADGEVHPNSVEANGKVDKGIKDCDFKLFSEGLHTLQDSWAHQGKPYMDGLGHARGAIQIPRVGAFGVGVGGQWIKLSGVEAALSTSADDVTIWPADARAAAMASYQKMLQFKQACPCACPGPNGTKTKTSSGDAQPEGSVGAALNQKFPGNNRF